MSKIFFSRRKWFIKSFTVFSEMNWRCNNPKIHIFSKTFIYQIIRLEQSHSHPIFRISTSIGLRSPKMTFRWLEAFWHYIKSDRSLLLQGHNGFNLSWKLCLNLCSLRWLKATRRCINNFKPETSLAPAALFVVGRVKSKSALGNTEYKGAWQIEVWSLFHSLIACGKK